MKSSILTGIADNPALLEELRRVIEGEFASSSEELGFSNERLGERVRARLEGLEAIDRAFKKITQFKTIEPKPESINRGR